MLDILPNPWCALTYVVLIEDLFDITTNNVKTIFRVCLVYVCIRVCTCGHMCVYVGAPSHLSTRVWRPEAGMVMSSSVSLDFVYHGMTDLKLTILPIWLASLLLDPALPPTHWDCRWAATLPRFNTESGDLNPCSRLFLQLWIYKAMFLI